MARTTTPTAEQPEEFLEQPTEQPEAIPEQPTEQPDQAAIGHVTATGNVTGDHLHLEIGRSTYSTRDAIRLGFLRP